MRSKRLIGAVIAGLVFIVTVAGLLMYTSGAETRAMAGLDPIAVLVAVRDIPAGSPSAALAQTVAIKQVPRAAVEPNAVTDIAQLADLLSMTDIKAGEQLLTHRWGTEAQYQGKDVKIPAGLIEMSFQMNVPQAAGGIMKPGDKVAMFVIVDKKVKLMATHLLVSKLLNDASEDASKRSQVVTLALTPTDAAKAVLIANDGMLWLGLENADSPNETPGPFGVQVVLA